MGSDNQMESKKAAMFGLEGESLKKQSGELFLARLQRLTFRLVGGHQATRLLNSKAAMFGLDARIALAIFGALSVIAGAALYNTIQNIRVISTLANMREVVKAVEQYYLDTGVMIANRIGSERYISYLVENTDNQANWNGPYITVDSLAEHAISSKGINYLLHKCDSSFGGDVGTVCPTCVDDENCAMWLKVTFGDFNNLAFANRLDQKIDNGDGLDTGIFRVKFADVVSSDDVRSFYKIMPIKQD